MIPNIPQSVWDQLGVVVIFAFLLGGEAYTLVKLFLSGIADINKHYADLLQRSNEQWQKYFDARIQTSNELTQRMTQRMDSITELLEQSISDANQHDLMVRQALDAMSNARTNLSKTTPRARTIKQGP